MRFVEFIKLTHYKSDISQLLHHISRFYEFTITLL